MSLLCPSRPGWLKRYGHYFHGYNQVVSSGVREGWGGSMGARQTVTHHTAFAQLQPSTSLLQEGSYFKRTSLSFRERCVCFSTGYLCFLQSELHYVDLMAPIILLDFMFYVGQKKKNVKTRPNVFLMYEFCPLSLTCHCIGLQE